MTDVLFLSTRSPGKLSEKDPSRAARMLQRLAGSWPVHLACFVESREQAEAAQVWAKICASVHCEIISPHIRRIEAAARFVAGGCFGSSYYRSRRMRRYVRSLVRRAPVGATLALSPLMAEYAPNGLPLLLDLARIESKRYFEEAAHRFPGLAYRLEGHRLHGFESWYANRARRTLLAHAGDEAAVKRCAPKASIALLEDGVDFDYLDPGRMSIPALLAGRQCLFLSAGQSKESRQSASWFADAIFPEVRRRDPALELVIEDSAWAARLRRTPGVLLAEGVPDKRHCLAAASAVIVPDSSELNRALEPLAMGKLALVSGRVAESFGRELPAGMVRCDRPQDWLDAVQSLPASAAPYPAIRKAAAIRFCWDKNLGIVTGEVEAALSSVNPLRSAGLA